MTATASRVRWLGSRNASRRELREALAYWVDRSEDIAKALRPHEPLPTTAEFCGILSKAYALGMSVRDKERGRV